MATFSPMKDQALIALRGTAPSQRLALRLRSRKNLPRGCIMSRPRFFGIPAPAAKRMRPAHSIWHCNASSVRPGENLPPAFTDPNFNRAIKAVLAKRPVEHAENYSSHGCAAEQLRSLRRQGRNGRPLPPRGLEIPIFSWICRPGSFGWETWQSYWPKPTGWALTRIRYTGWVNGVLAQCRLAVGVRAPLTL